MEATKLQVKFFFDLGRSSGVAAPGASSAVRFEPFLNVFHDWIRRDALDELVIDVADYGHVERGPGVVLVGHEGDYYIDDQDGQPGLLYSRKRGAPAPDARLKDAFRRVLHAARLLEGEASLQPLRFRTDEALIRVPERLVVANDRAGFESVRAELESFSEWLYSAGSGAGKPTLEHLGSERQPLTVRVKSSAAPELSRLVERLGSSNASAAPADG